MRQIYNLKIELQSEWITIFDRAERREYKIVFVYKNL